MAAFGATAQFDQDCVIDAALGVHEAAQIERIRVIGSQRFVDSHVISKFRKLVFAIQ